MIFIQDHSLEMVPLFFSFNLCAQKDIKKKKAMIHFSGVKMG